MSKNKQIKSINNIFHSWMVILGISIGIILITPFLMPYQFLCLKNNSTESFFYYQCKSGTIMDKIIILNIITIATTGITTYLAKIQRPLLHSIVSMVIVSVISIASFYWHLPRIISRVEKTPIILDQHLANP